MTHTLTHTPKFQGAPCFSLGAPWVLLKYFLSGLEGFSPVGDLRLLCFIFDEMFGAAQQEKLKHSKGQENAIAVGLTLQKGSGIVYGKVKAKRPLCPHPAGRMGVDNCGIVRENDFNGRSGEIFQALDIHGSLESI